MQFQPDSVSDYEDVYNYEYSADVQIPEYSDLEIELQTATVVFISTFFDWIYDVQFAFAILGFLVNFPHFVVLMSRKMRSSSINILMGGIAFFDIFIMFQVIVAYFYEHFVVMNRCLPMETFLETLGLFVLNVLGATLLRASPWLGLSMALIRVVVLTFPLNGRAAELSDAPAGKKVLLGVLAGNAMLSLFWYSRFSIVRNGRWRPERRCGYPRGYSQLMYTIVVARRVLFIPNDVSTRVFSVVNGICHVMPAFVYPLIAALLVFQLSKAKAQQKTLRSCHAENEKNRKTRLVILMTFTFFVSQLPAGITTFLQTFYDMNPVLSAILEYEDVLNTVLFTVNATSHCIIFMVMSSNYRKVAREMFWCGKQKNEVILVRAVSNGAHGNDSD